MKILCVAEKPSIAKGVASILSNNSYRTRVVGRNASPNYDFKFNFGGNLGNCDVIMTSVRGNVKGLEFPENYQWGRCDPKMLFSAPILTVNLKGSYKIVQNLEKEAKNCDKLMIWTDCDREGESIGYSIFEIVRKSNARITLSSVLRAQFSHIERSHVLNAAKNPRKIDMKQVDASRARQEIDIRAGYAFTRFVSAVFQPLFPEKKTISYGSCQFPTLGFVVHRYIRVREFVSEPFWTIAVTTVKKNARTQFSWSRPSLFDRAIATALYLSCSQCEDPEYGVIVAKIEKPTSNYKPYPLTTVELQKIAARSFKMSAKTALSAAEDLYNKGYISYPRTETDSFPKSMDLKKLVEVQKQSPQWGNYAASLLTDNKYSEPRSGRHNDEAHPPIHPVQFVDASSLDQKQKKIYELVVRHFLACCSQDAKGNLATATLKWGHETFTASALEVTAQNYLEIYPYRKWSSTRTMPPFSVGERVKLFSTELKEGKTSPPEYMTEAELIALMDANGIGTDATIAEHISKVQEREYVTCVKERSKTFLIPSELGMGLVLGFEKIDFNDNLSLTKPFLRKDVEMELERICKGERVKTDVVQRIVGLYSEAYDISVMQKPVLVRSYQEVARENL